MCEEAPQPVCGCDGITYWNDCLRRAAGITAKRFGECDPGVAQTSGGKVALQDLVVFTRQLATMIDAGLAMVQCLQALADQTQNKVMRDVIKDVCARVEGGDSFSEALSKHPKVFTRLYVSMVGAGEKGGTRVQVRVPSAKEAAP